MDYSCIVMVQVKLCADWIIKSMTGSLYLRFESMVESRTMLLTKLDSESAGIKSNSNSYNKSEVFLC